MYESGEDMKIFRKVWSVSVTRSSSVFIEPFGFYLERMKVRSLVQREPMHLLNAGD